MMTATEFYNKTINKEFDVDGAYGAQCWDLFAYFCQCQGYAVINCTSTGYAKDLWNQRNSSGILKNFSIVSVKDMKNGDWIIWGDCDVAPVSHVAMFVNYADSSKTSANVLGQNQAGKTAANKTQFTLTGVLGVFRPKVYDNYGQYVCTVQYETINGYRRYINVYSQDSLTNTGWDGRYNQKLVIGNESANRNIYESLIDGKAGGNVTDSKSTGKILLVKKISDLPKLSSQYAEDNNIEVLSLGTSGEYQCTVQYETINGVRRYINVYGQDTLTSTGWDGRYNQKLTIGNVSANRDIYASLVNGKAGGTKTDSKATRTTLLVKKVTDLPNL